MKKFDMSLFENITRVDEITYKDIMNVISPNDLPHKDYSKLIKFVRYVEMRKDTMKFFVPNIYNGWNFYVQFVDFNEQVQDKSINAVECARLLLWESNIRVHCTCPAFRFWGSEYVLTQLDAAIIPENRFPHIRNPFLKGIVCKHGARTLKVLNFHLGDLAAYIKIQRQNM
jgi:hypothetical protein